MSDRLKTKITKAVLAALPDSSTFKNVNIGHLLFRWWFTGRAGGTLRLTEEGKLAFTEANLEYFDFPLAPLKKVSISSKEYTLTIGKKISCPFYIGLKTESAKSAYIRIYDSKVAMLIQLYGTFNEYLTR